MKASRRLIATTQYRSLCPVNITSTDYIRLQLKYSLVDSYRDQLAVEVDQTVRLQFW